MDLKHFFVDFFKWILNQRTQKKFTFNNVLKNLTQYHYHMEEMQKCGACNWSHNIFIKLIFFASYKMKSNHSCLVGKKYILIYTWAYIRYICSMTPNCTFTLGAAFVQESWIFITLVEKGKKHQIGRSRYRWKGLEV
jgi:hypothetical protein